MIGVLLLSIGLRLAALTWSLVLLRRLRDWRMGVLSAMLMLMAARQLLTLRHHFTSGVAGLDPRHGFVDELPGLVVSVLGLAFVVLLDRLLLSQRSAASGRKRAEGDLAQSRQRYRTLIESTPDVIFTVSADGQVTSLSPAFETLTGWPPAEWIGRSFAELVHPEDRGAAGELFTDLARGKVFPRSELRIVDRHGMERVGELAIHPELQEGRFVGALGIARDITEPKRAERERDAALAGFQRIADSVPDCFWSTEFDAAGKPRVRFVSAGWKTIWGFEPEEIYEDSELWLKAVVPEDRRLARRAFEDAQVRKETRTATYRIRTKEGDLRWIEDTMSPLFDGDGGLVGLYGVARDITVRRQTQEALQLVAQAVSGTTGDDFFRVLVRRLTEALDLDHALVGELVEGREEVIRTIAAVVSRKPTETFEYALAGTPCENVVGKDLCCFPRDVSEKFPRDRMLVELSAESYVGTPLFDSAGRSLGLLAVIGSKPVDDPELAESVLRIFAVRAAAELERMRAEGALARSEERYRSLFEESQDAIFISTPEGKLLDINPAGVALFGFDSKEDLLAVDIGRDLYWDRWEREVLVQHLAGEGAVRDRELQLRRRDGSRLVVLETATAVKDEAGRIVAYRGLLRDVTQQRELEEQLRQAQRMEAVGRLAGGVAEDFGKQLSIIKARSESLQEGLAPDDPLARQVAEIRTAGQRAETLTRQLLIMSGRHVSRPRLVDLNRVIADTERLLRRVADERIRLALRSSSEPAEVMADPRQIEQVLLNLAINARQAMPEGGVLTVSTSNVELDAAGIRGRLGLRPGAYVLLKVEDTGRGFDARAREHLFEPFFADGDAEVGMGLATVYGIVEQSGGSIRVDSDPGVGTRFEIFLPRVTAGERLADRRPAPREGAGEGGTVLLAEDEAAVRQLLADFLIESGYRVIAAADGEEALSLADGAEGTIDLLITDMVMPGIGGIDLARRLKAAHPAIRVLFMSGYAQDPSGFLGGGSALDGGAGFIRKPFSTADLAGKLRDLLAGC